MPLRVLTVGRLRRCASANFATASADPVDADSAALSARIPIPLRHSPRAFPDSRSPSKIACTRRSPSHSLELLAWKMLSASWLLFSKLLVDSARGCSRLSRALAVSVLFPYLTFACPGKCHFCKTQCTIMAIRWVRYFGTQFRCLAVCVKKFVSEVNSLIKYRISWEAPKKGNNWRGFAPPR